MKEINDKKTNYCYYYAFISYSHLDKKKAFQLHSCLESFVFPVFIDIAELPVTPNLSKEIEKALDDSVYLIVLCSESSAKSQWVNQEIAHFKRAKDEGHIIPIILETGTKSDNFFFPQELKEIVDRCRPVLSEENARNVINKRVNKNNKSIYSFLARSVIFPDIKNNECERNYIEYKRVNDNKEISKFMSLQMMGMILVWCSLELLLTLLAVAPETIRTLSGPTDMRLNPIEIHELNDNLKSSGFQIDGKYPVPMHELNDNLKPSGLQKDGKYPVPMHELNDNLKSSGFQMDGQLLKDRLFNKFVYDNESSTGGDKSIINAVRFSAVSKYFAPFLHSVEFQDSIRQAWFTPDNNLDIVTQNGRLYTYIFNERTMLQREKPDNLLLWDHSDGLFIGIDTSQNMWIIRNGETKKIDKLSAEFPKGISAVCIYKSNIVFLGLDSGEILLFDLQTGKVRKRIKDSGKRVQRLSIFGNSKTGTLLTCITIGGSITLYRLDSLERQKRFNLKSPIRSAMFSPVSGGRIIILLENGNLLVKDIHTNMNKKLFGHNNGAECMNVGGDGHLLATGGANGIIVLWDLISLEDIAVFKGADNTPSFIVFGSKVLAVGDPLYKVINFWDMKTIEKTIFSVR